MTAENGYQEPLDLSIGKKDASAGAPTQQADKYALLTAPTLLLGIDFQTSNQLKIACRYYKDLQSLHGEKVTSKSS